MSTAARQELDSLASLEERITRAVELVSALRAENSNILAQLETAVSERDAARQELDDMRSERRQVRTRIEKLLGQMDLLSAT
jgi:FtsZ-binding cell division protein ZapB